MEKKTIEGKFARALIINAVAYTHFKMREADVGDMIDAEGDVGPGTLIAYNTAMMTRQLVSVRTDNGKEFTGPFIVDHLRTLHARDYAALREAQKTLDALGEPQSGTTPTISPAS